MKICMLTTSFPRYREDFVGQWVLGLAQALVAEGANVTVVAPHDQATANYEEIYGVEIRRFHYWWPKSAHGLCYGAGIPTNIRTRKWLALQLPFLEAGFLSAALRYGKDADVYNAHWTFAGFPTALVSRLSDKPLITAAYSAEYIPKALAPINRFVVNSSSAVFSISQFTYDVVERIIHPRYHRVIALGVNREKIAPSDFDVSAFRMAKGVNPEEYLIFAVGRLVERKGFHVLVEAISELVKSGEKVRLLLAGTGPDRNSLLNQTKSLGVEDHIQLLGFIPDSELAFYLKAADVLVMPSILDHTGDTEGLGIPLLEAMANQTPVIASAIGGILDIVEDERTGLLVRPGDIEELANAIRRLKSDLILSEHLIDRGLELVNTKFSWKIIAQQALDMFEIALKHKH